MEPRPEKSKRRSRRMGAVSRDLLDALRRLPRGEVRTSAGELGKAISASRNATRRALEALEERGLITRNVITEAGCAVGTRVCLVDAPVLMENETAEDDDLDAHLVALTRDPSHPRHMAACAAHLLRHGRERGWVGIAPPRTKAEFETAWPPKPATEPAGAKA
jgi:DNA-binding transcriptional ArsR family regulator